ncbi:hypothetical protein QR680_005861 [Steinernema hermaphroditum]|uniref:J domain-containing protein n=1 Tax=Steinernema hermaphroditum TaxID=289476 RepID=A0AA39HTL6_9BILA|nr:hypothetical protein QR680_005861 [Steinernema hermaphroditum]
MISHNFRRLISFSAYLRRTYYDVLGISRNSSKIDIERAYWELSDKYRPSSAGARIGAAARFREINAAYETLSDSEKRKAYDDRVFGRSRAARHPFDETFPSSQDIRREYEERLNKIREEVEARTRKYCSSESKYRDAFSAAFQAENNRRGEHGTEQSWEFIRFSDATVRLIFRVYISLLGVVLFYQLFYGAFNDKFAKEIREKMKSAVPDVRPVNVDDAKKADDWRTQPEWGFDTREDGTGGSDDN